MSLDFSLSEIKRTEIFSSNITHNLGEMAEKSGIYDSLWRPYRLHKDFKETGDYNKEREFENSVVIKAKNIISHLEKGLKELKDRPEYFKKFDAKNGWGTYEHFVPFVEEILKACKDNPDAKIEISR
jgi:hypothetical protein